MKLLHSPFFLFFPAFPPHFLFLVCKLKYCKLFLPKIVKVRVVMARCIPEKQRQSPCWSQVGGGRFLHAAASASLC